MNSLVTWTKGLKERIQEAEKEIQMREIKFRGVQRFGENKGKLAFGSLLILGLRHYIVPIPPKHETPADDVTLLAQVCERVEVDAETVGQFTGLKDKNGIEIYCGDKLQDLIDDDIGTVYWKESAAGFYCLWGDGSDMSLNYGVATVKCEIIGNTHPELLEQDNE